MTVSLAEQLARLPETEIDRLQKKLRVILRHYQEPGRLRRTLQNVFENLGAPSECLARLGPDALRVFQKLLDNFGNLTRGQLKAGEQELLQKIPYVIWTDEEHCSLCAEAESSVGADPFFQEKGYLFSLIRSLPLKEKKAWGAWLHLSETHITRSNLEREIYNRVASLRQTAVENDPVDVLEDPYSGAAATGFPGFLNDVFPEDRGALPLNWFYRGILPLYSALAQTDQSHANRLSHAQNTLLQWMKSGQVVARAVTAEFGQSERWRLVRTRENFTGVQRPGFQADRELAQELLF